MNEAYVRREVYRYLRTLGYWPTRGRDASSCPRCKAKILPPIGRPDLIVLIPSGLNRVVEVKAVNMEKTKSFSVDEITEEQVRWLDAWTAEGGLGYLAIGTVAEKKRSLWIIDWAVWKSLFEEVVQYQRSISVYEKDISRVAMRNANLSIEQRLSDYRATRRSGEWELPKNHSLSRLSPTR